MSQGYRNGNYVSFSPTGAMANEGPRPGVTQEESIEQVRDLLFGVFRREMDARLAALERRVEAVEQQVKVATENASRDRRAAFDQLARNVGELSEEIRRISRG